jgi:hypothetical protein
MAETAHAPPPLEVDGTAPVKQPATAGPIANWLKGCGIEDDDEGTIMRLLVQQAGGDDTSLLGGIKEAPLLMAAGPIGLRGIKLRKLLAVLPGVTKPAEQAEQAEHAAAATGDPPKPHSAFDALVATSGPPPPSPRGGGAARQPLPIVTTPPSTPPTVAPRPAPSLSVGLTREGASLSAGADEPPIFTERTQAAFSVLSAQGAVNISDAPQMTPRTIEAIKVAAAADGAATSTPLPLNRRPLALAALPSPEEAALLTDRTADALRKLGSVQEESGGGSVDMASITPRTIVAVKASAQALEDEKLAMSLQAALDDEVSHVSTYPLPLPRITHAPTLHAPTTLLAPPSASRTPPHTLTAPSARRAVAAR